MNSLLARSHNQHYIVLLDSLPVEQLLVAADISVVQVHTRMGTCVAIAE